MKFISFYFCLLLSFILFSTSFCLFDAYGTHYLGFTTKVNPDFGKSLQCGFSWLPTKARKYYAAMQHTQYGTGENCGRCAIASCKDPLCPAGLKSLTVMIGF